MHILHLVLAGLLTFSSTSDEWIRVKGPDHLSFLFPNHAQRLKKEIEGAQSWIFQTKNLTCVFRRRMYEIEYGKRDIQRPYRNAIVPTNEKRDPTMEIGRPERRKNIPHKDMEIKEICYTITERQGNMIYYKRFIFRNNCMYQIVIGGKSKLLNEILIQKEKFFHSVSFNPKP